MKHLQLAGELNGLGEKAIEAITAYLIKHGLTFGVLTLTIGVNYTDYLNINNLVIDTDGEFTCCDEQGDEIADTIPVHSYIRLLQRLEEGDYTFAEYSI